MNENNETPQENVIVEGLMPYNIELAAQLEDMQAPVVELADGAFAVHKNYTVNKDFYTGKRLQDFVNATFSNADDFVDFVTEYKQAGSKAFYNENAVVVHFNYPQATKADYNDSRATLTLKKTETFKKFATYAGQTMDQRGFVRFLKVMEEHITSQNGLELIALAENMKALKDVNSITKNAETGLSINIKVDTGISNVRVPERIALQLPINEAMPEALADFEIECFYSFDDGRGFQVELECYQKEQIVEEQTREAVKAIVARMGVKAYRI